jgi:hypothetical protein
MTSPDTAFRLMLALCGASVTIRTLELLANGALFTPRGSLSWVLIRESGAYRGPRWLEGLLDGAGFRFVLIVRVISSCGLLLFADTALFGPCVVAVAVTSLLVSSRMPVGQDGSDQMNSLILMPAAIAVLCQEEWAKTAILIFVAAQVSLAYATSGITKLISPLWRSGQALPEILSTLSYGNGLAARALSSNRTVSLAACWSVIVFETLFCSWVVLNQPGLQALLTIGVTFHVFSAVLMGLNCFLWSFVATYPAIFFIQTNLGPLVRL